VERLAGIAAALLDGPVAVSGAGLLPLAERLQLLDAIAALLPRGFRADLSASSAVSGLNVPRMRLILSDEEDHSHQQMHLQGAATEQWSHNAREYYERLVQTAASQGLQTVLLHLWAQTAPSSPSPGRGAEATAAIRVLGELDRDSELDRRARDVASIDLKFALVYFAEPRAVLGRVWPALPPASRDTLLDCLLRNESQDTTRALVKTWDIVVRDLIALAISDLDRGSTVIAERGLHVAAATGTSRPADQYLEYILVSGRGDTAQDDWPSRIGPRVDLLVDLEVPRPDECALTRARLRFGPPDGWQARLVRALLAKEFATGQTTRARGWALWLSGAVGDGEEVPQDWLNALDFIVGQRGKLGLAAPAIEELTRADPGWVPLLISVALAFERLTEALELLSPGLVQRALQAPDDGALRSVLEAPFREAGALAADLAWVDAARMVAHLEPRYIPDPGRQVDLFNQYVTGMDHVLSLLAGNPGARDLVQGTFQRCVLGVGPSDDNPFPRAAVELIKRWAADAHRAPLLARYIRTSDTDARLLMYNQLGPEVWDRLAVHEPGFRALRSTGLLQGAILNVIEDPGGRLARTTFDFIDEQGERHIGVCASGLAEALYQACADGMSPTQILTVLRGVNTRGRAPGEPRTFISAVPPTDFWDALRELQSMLRHGPPDRTGRTNVNRHQQAARADAAWLEFLDCIIEKRILGGDYSEVFREVLTDKATEAGAVYDELRRRFRRRWIRVARAARGPGQAAPRAERAQEDRRDLPRP
jgi:hypothetical protein